MNEDQKIRELFAELKCDEERDAPDFEKLWSAATLRAAENRRRRFFLRVTAAAAALALIGIAIALLITPQRGQGQRHAAVPPARNVPAQLPWQSIMLISQWRSPTDFLLDTTTEDILPIHVRDIFPGQTSTKN
jgi:hypothetical protein